MKPRPTAPASGAVRPAFVVGVTGHMDLDPAYRDQIKADLKSIFDWLGDSSKRLDGAPLDPGLGLTHTPLVLLSSLAPGADQWAVEAAREANHPAGLRILAPLPFVKNQYLEASTFKREGVMRDEAASRFLADFPDEDTFVVRLPEEVDLDDEALRARHRPILIGLEGKRERDHRYAAAGEYVAAYSDLLIALTDKPAGEAETAALIPGESPGARAIAELKRRGVTPGLLPILPALSWVDNGPVIHIYAPRKAKPTSSSSPMQGQGEVAPSSSGRGMRQRLEVLYPYDSRPAHVGEREHQHPDWHTQGYALLKIVTDHLQRLNGESIGLDPRREDRAFAEMLPGMADAPAGAGPGHALPTASEPLKKTLDRLARLRRRVADLSLHYQTRFHRLKHALFALAFCAALFFSLAEYWEAPEPGWPLRQAFFWVALVAIATAWLAYFCFEKSIAIDERYNDYRALAEGLRVQFYWTAAGTGQSVASHYLQRQRGELGWIRNAISAVALPYEPDRVRFNQLSQAAQCAALRSVRQRWIDEQQSYFERQIEELTRRKRRFSTYAGVLIWTGFTVQAFFLFFAGSSEAAALPRPLALLLSVAGALVLGALYLRSRPGPRTKAQSPKSVASSQARIESARQATEGGARRSLSTARAWSERIWSEWIESVRSGRAISNGLQVIALTLLALGTVYLLEALVPGLPRAPELGGLCKNLALAAGVLCGAWVEASFFEENLRRYSSMASLFQAAAQRFDDHFGSLERVPPDQKAAVEQQAIAHVQGLLVAVGREALSENAEWLITHRIRPVEPVSAY